MHHTINASYNQRIIQPMHHTIKASYNQRIIQPMHHTINANYFHFKSQAIYIQIAVVKMQASVLPTSATKFSVLPT
jgi:hypothetical protein